VAPFHWMRILPRGPSNSMRHSASPIARGATISTKEATGAQREVSAWAISFSLL
jgi:hypothetical protein